MHPHPGTADRVWGVHEVALSNQLAGVVRRAAGGRRVTGVHLKIGALRQVVPETLRWAWGFVIDGTDLADAELEVEWIPLVIECANGHVTEVTGQLDLTCPECPAKTTIVGGEEFTVVDIEVA